MHCGNFVPNFESRNLTQVLVQSLYNFEEDCQNSLLLFIRFSASVNFQQEKRFL